MSKMSSIIEYFHIVSTVIGLMWLEMTEIKILLVFLLDKKGTLVSNGNYPTSQRKDWSFWHGLKIE